MIRSHYDDLTCNTDTSVKILISCLLWLHAWTSVHVHVRVHVNVCMQLKSCVYTGFHTRKVYQGTRAEVSWLRSSQPTSCVS